MSAGPPTSEPPTAGDLVQQFPIDPVEAQAIVDALEPFEDFTNVGSSVGAVLENAPGSGLPFVGAVLRTVAMQVNLASQSAETVARAVDFYITAQAGAADDLFPPPDQMAAELEQQANTIGDVFRNDQF